MRIIALAIWTTSGTFMLMFLAALQDIPEDVEEAAMMDGTTSWQRFRAVTLPALKPTLFLVLTLGLIGTWQVFDAVYIMSQGAPAKTTLTPAFLSYQTSFLSGKWGQGAAIAFILFAIIVAFSLLQGSSCAIAPSCPAAVASQPGRANDHHPVRTPGHRPGRNASS